MINYLRHQAQGCILGMIKIWPWKQIERHIGVHKDYHHLRSLNPKFLTKWRLRSLFSMVTCNGNAALAPTVIRTAFIPQESHWGPQYTSRLYICALTASLKTLGVTDRANIIDSYNSFISLVSVVHFRGPQIESSWKNSISSITFSDPYISQMIMIIVILGYLALLRAAWQDKG